MEDIFQSKCCIENNEYLGRYIKAKQNIGAGECLLLEQPSLLMASNGERRCQNCFKLTTTYCQACLITPLCCQCKIHYEYDCKKLAIMSNIELLKCYPDTYGFVKFLLLRENPETQKHFGIILEAESHLEKRRNTKIWLYHEQTVVQPLLKSGLLNFLTNSIEITEDFLQNLCSVVDVNSFEIRAPDIGCMKAIYVQGALLSHDCMANTCISIDDKYCIKIYANQAIKANEIVTNCYTNILLNTVERRKMLQQGKYFHCTCVRCEDPTELGSHMSTIICTKCHKGYMIKSKANDENLYCPDCKHQETDENINKILFKLQAEDIQNAKKLNEMEIVLQKVETILHPQHYLIIDLKQNIAAGLRDIINDIGQCPDRKIYERKIEFCKDVLKVLNLIAPGISRLKAIVIYELSSTWAEYNRMRYQEKDLTKKNLRDLLQESEKMLRESIRMLLHEPKETPEGKLSQSMMQELKYLQTDIKMLK